MESKQQGQAKPDGQIIAEFLGWKVELVQSVALDHWAVIAPNGVMISKLLATFWGTHEVTYNTEIRHLCNPKGLFGEYASNWSKIMPVVAKIRNICYEKFGDTDKMGEIFRSLMMVDIVCTFKYCLKFINEYNEWEAQNV